MLFVIARKELKSLLISPFAWLLPGMMLAVAAWVFFGRLDAYLHVQPQLQQIANAPGFTEIIVTPVFATTAIMLLMIIPLLTMRLLAEERKSNTLVLLVSAPVSISEIVLGKFLGIMAYLCAIVLCIAMLTVTLLAGGTPDFGLIFCGVLGLLLVVCCFVALGLYISSLTAQPVLAALGTLGALLCFWVLELAGGDEGWLQYLSILKHFEQFNSGLLDSFSVVYLILLTLFFIVLTIRRLDGERLYQ